jgi:hypothetical protein
MSIMRRHTYPSVSTFTEKLKIATYATTVSTTLHHNGFNESTSGDARPRFMSDGSRKGGEIRKVWVNTNRVEVARYPVIRCA